MNVAFLALLPLLAACPPITVPLVGEPAPPASLEEGRWIFTLSDAASTRACAERMGLEVGGEAPELGATLRFVGDRGLDVNVDGLHMSGAREGSALWAAGSMRIDGAPTPEPGPEPVGTESSEGSEGSDGSDGSDGSEGSEGSEDCAGADRSDSSDGSDGCEEPRDERPEEPAPSAESLMWVGFEADVVAADHLVGDLELVIEEPDLVCTFTFALDGALQTDDGPPVYEEPMPGGDEPITVEPGDGGGSAEPSPTEG